MTKENLLTLFSDCLYTVLKSHNLGFKCYSDNDFIITDLTKSDIVDFDRTFILNNLSSCSRIIINKKNHLPFIFHELISKYPEIVYSQLSSFSAILFHSDEKGISLYSLQHLFEKEDLVQFLKNYTDTHFIFTRFYSFSSFLSDINSLFKNHDDYDNIILHQLKIHSKLIKKSQGNIIQLRAWCYKHVNSLKKFEEFIYLKNEKPLFSTIKLNTLLKFIDVETTKIQYSLINPNFNYGSIDIYGDFFKSFILMLNSPSMKKELQIEEAEGSFVFHKKNYQLIFFSKNKLDTDLIEEKITLLLQAVCDYHNTNNSKDNDFEFSVFKNFLFYQLQKKLTPTGIKKEKGTKI